MTYPMPENITGFGGFMSYANTVTGDWFAKVILLTFFFVVFISMKQYKTRQAFAVASWSCMIISVFMRMLGLMSDIWMFVFIILTGIGTIWLVWGSD
jgi:hypothetical protein